MTPVRRIVIRQLLSPLNHRSPTPTDPSIADEFSKRARMYYTINSSANVNRSRLCRLCDPRKFPERIPRTSYLGQTTSGRGETHPPGESVASCAVALFAAFLSRNCRDRSPPDPRDFDHEESWWNDGKKRRRWHAAPWYRDTDTPRSLSAQRRQTTSGTFLAILLHIRGYTRGESEPSWRQIAWLQEGRTRPRTEIV